MLISRYMIKSWERPRKKARTVYRANNLNSYYQFKINYSKCTVQKTPFVIYCESPFGNMIESQIILHDWQLQISWSCFAFSVAIIMCVFILAISCGIPKAPTNGGILTTDYLVGTRVTYFCNDGYRLSSKELTTATCQSDGTWSNHNKTPRCVGMHIHWNLSVVCNLYAIWLETVHTVDF